MKPKQDMKCMCGHVLVSVAEQEAIEKQAKAEGWDLPKQAQAILAIWTANGKKYHE